jgi:uncharacterized membrane protein YbaN (DUF454 family)
MLIGVVRTEHGGTTMKRCVNMTKEQLDRFARWLLERGIADEYLKEYTNNYGISAYSELILGSFNWNDTKSGQDFWLARDKEWQAFLDTPDPNPVPTH